MERNIVVVLVGADNQQEFRDITIKPGTRCLDLLRDLNLSGYAIRKPDDSGQFFAANDDIYAAVEKSDKSKLEAVPDMPVSGKVGPSGPTAILTEFLRRLYPGRRTTTPRRNPIVVGPRPSTRIGRAPMPYWRDKGWHQTDVRTLRGRYVLSHGAWDGEIVRGVRDGKIVYTPWIFNPPEAVKNHPHPLCLRFAGRGHWLHFEKDPNSPDGALVALENYLAESFAATEGR